MEPLMLENSTDKSHIITTLQSKLVSLQNKVKELQVENSKLVQQLANCQCNKEAETVNGSAAECGSSVEKANGKVAKKKGKGLDIKSRFHFNKRYIALKFMYFGQRFYGFSAEAQMEPTVESELFKALAETRLIDGDWKEIQYSRCGRTDKGVSAVGQVIALLLRSKLKETDAIGRNRDAERQTWSSSEGEIDYVRILNRVLPRDIRVIGWCPAPLDFNARFSCLGREYKYFFWKDNLDISAMEIAGKKFVGEHDFTNFCKMDAVRVHKYRRHVTSFEIFPCNMRSGDNELWTIKVKGSAFLWHQVRCMVSVLFMVGRGLESPDIVDTLLDTSTTRRKPQYTMAPEIPLVLCSCEFEGLKFICSSDSNQALHEHLLNECQVYQLQIAIVWEALQCCMPMSKEQRCTVDKPIKKVSHIPLMSRPTEPSYEERRTKLSLKS